MNRKFVVISLLVVASSVGVLAFSRPGISTGIASAPPPQHTAVPEHVIYQHLFHHVFLMGERAGYKSQAGLTDEQARLLSEVAAEGEREVQQVDARAKVIIDAFRARYPGGRVPSGEVPPPPPAEIRALQAERNAAILRARDRLRAAFGEQEFSRFSEFVRNRVAPNITQLPPRR